MTETKSEVEPTTAGNEQDEPERQEEDMDLLNWLVAAIFGIVWLINGLILNAIQFILYWTLRPVNRHLYRRINYYLTYSSWSQIVALAEFWSGSSIRVYYADEQTATHFGKEHAITVMNHRYELDWLFAWIIIDKFRILGGAKSFAKKSLKWIPVMGWGWIFCEFIFLERNWDKDSLIIGQKLDQLMEYVDTILVLLFCEGTRFTKEKYEASIEFAQKRGLPLLKYHLLPRSRGFVLCIQHLKNKLPAVYNIQLAFPDNLKYPPTFITVLKGEPLVGDLYVERIPMDKIPTGSDEDISNFLMDMYKKKDDLMIHYKEKGTFPGRLELQVRRKSPLFHWLFWFTTVVSGLSYLIWNLVTSKHVVLLRLVMLALFLGLIVFLVLVRTTKAQKGSKYGASPKKAAPEAATAEEAERKRKLANGVESADTVSSDPIRRRIVTQPDSVSGDEVRSD